MGAEVCVEELPKVFSQQVVKYCLFLGIRDRKIVGYVFRDAMLPQIIGLALAIGTMVGGALVAEIIFSYPGLGTTLLNAIRGQDYPLISAVTLIITVMVLSANFIITHDLSLAHYISERAAILYRGCAHYGRCPAADKALGCDRRRPALLEAGRDHFVTCFRYRGE